MNSKISERCSRKGSEKIKFEAYSLNLGRNLGKGNPLNEADLEEFLKLQKTKADSDKSWSVDVSAVDQTTFDLSVNNPNEGGEIVLRDPKEILEEINKFDQESKKIIKTIENAFYD